MSGLLPREHGAYAQLGFPLATGLLYAGGQPGALAFTLAAVALFLAHEPLALRTGMRGPRLQRELGDRAGRRILFLGGMAAAGLLAAAWLAPARAWLGAIVPGGLGLLLLPALGTKRMKSIPAEILAALVFSTSLVPLALAGAAPLRDVTLAVLVWFGASFPAIFTVHAIKAALKKRPDERWLLTAAPAVAAATIAIFVVAGLAVPGASDLLAVLPPTLVTLTLSIRLPHPRLLKPVGWTMVVADALTLLLLFLL
ncbi:MAG: YwiC-like family protein [Gemmatimonadota bacterium]